MSEVTTAQLRTQIMKERGLIPPKAKRVRAVKYEIDLTIMENIPLLPKMKYIEAKFGVKVKEDVFIGSINDVCQRYKWEVDRSTISRWRKYLKRFLMEAIR